MNRYFYLLAFFLTFTLQAQQLDVYFDFDKSGLNATATEKLEDLTKSSPDLEITKIYGYCDWKGSNSYNDSLSLRRVRSVYQFLKQKNTTILQGYEEKGYGEDFPQSPIQADNRKVSIIYRIKEKEAPVSELAKSITEAKEGDLIKLPNLYFFNNSARLVPKSEPTLKELLCALQDHPNLKIEIQGHICCQAERDTYDISTARAKAIYLYLTRNNIKRDRLAYKGYGVSRPVHPIPEKSPAEEDDNRRVEIRIVEK